MKIWKSAAAFVPLLPFLLALRCLAGEVKIEFLPPPMEGTISLGIYDEGGKLVRTLHHEAEMSEFTAALNGLVTRWDGMDNQGVACPPGKYHARGFMVGELDIDGVDFVGNDWVSDDDSPRISRITALAFAPTGGLFLKAAVPGQEQPSVFAVAVEAAEPGGEPEARLVSKPEADFPAPAADVPPLPSAQESAAGFGGARWAIEGGSVKEFSPTGELRRTVAAKPGDPTPVKLAASPTEEKIVLLEEGGALARLRELDFTGVAATAEPKVVFTKNIFWCERLDQVASLLAFPDGKPFVSEPAVTVALVPNPLMREKRGTVQVSVAVDKTGSLLTTADGLPLDHVSETPHLKWAVIGRAAGTKTATIFESDGAAVAEFKAARLANMMAFDAGDFEISAPPVEAVTPPTAVQDGEGPVTDSGVKPEETGVPVPTVAPVPTGIPAPTVAPVPTVAPSPVPVPTEAPTAAPSPTAASVPVN